MEDVLVKIIEGILVLTTNHDTGSSKADKSSEGGQKHDSNAVFDSLELE